MIGRSRLLVTAAAALALVAAGCGSEEEDLDVVEGQPVELGELSYNVQLTRFLNPNDREDAAYLRGQPRASADQEYLGVFMTIDNEGDSSQRVPDEMTIRDTRGTTYQPVESDSVYALELGESLPPDGEVPEPNTPAASGPVKGAMVLFLVDRTVTENRPIELEIPSSDGGEDARVELDI